VRVALAQILQLCFFAGIALAMGGKKLLPEHMQKTIDEHPMPAMLLVFFCNMAAGALLNTGAFEMSYNGMPIWSKLDTGRLPHMAELKDALSAVAFER